MTVPRPRSMTEAVAPDERAVSAFLDVSRALVGIAVYSVNAVPVDITVTQYRLLAIVGANGPCTITEVANLLGAAQSNATRHCDRLQRLELLHRSRSVDDGRVVLVDLTESGGEVVRMVTELRRREIRKVLGSLSGAAQARSVRAAGEFNRAAAELDDHPWLRAAW